MYTCSLSNVESDRLLKAMVLALISDPNIINVPDVQYGLINSNTNLNSSVENHLHSTTWRDLRQDTNLDSGTLFNVTLQREGTYECVIFLATLNLVHRTVVNFTVIGKL